MSEAQIEKEVQARVEFKMNELLTGVKNRVRFKHKQAFDMTQKSQYVWEAWKELQEMVRKETHMATVYKVEVVSHWISYSKEELERILQEAIILMEQEKGNDMQIKVLERD